MKRLALTLLLTVSGAAAAHAQASQETLADSVISALESNPTIMAQRRVRQGADENLIQARAGMLPSVGVTGSIGAYDNTVGEQFTAANGRSFPRDGQSDRGSLGLEARQSLFAGGAVTARKRQAEAGVDASRAELEGFSQDLILDVIRVFLDVRRSEEALEIRGANVDALAQQVLAASDRFDVGEVTRTDVSQSQARAAGSRAALVEARSDLAAARAEFEALVGRPAVQLAAPPPPPQTPGTLEAAIAWAMEGNPDLMESQAIERAAEQNARAARGDTMPRLDLVGRAGWRETRWDDTFRDSDTSIAAEVTVPLYKGGALRSKMRGAELNADKARFDRMAVERDVIRETTRIWHELNSFREAVDASAAQVEAAEIALEGTKQELSVGERITLDVLDQEQELLEARLALIDAERSAYLAAHALLAVTGRLTAETIVR